MSTIIEILEEHSKKYFELRKETSKNIISRLIELKLYGRVRRKRDGKIGELRYDCWSNSISFYPITKKGTVSERANGYTGDVENDYEPL